MHAINTRVYESRIAIEYHQIIILQVQQVLYVSNCSLSIKSLQYIMLRSIGIIVQIWASSKRRGRLFRLMKVGKLAHLVALFSVVSSTSTSGVAAADDKNVSIDDGLNPKLLRGVMNFIVNNNENTAESSCTASDEWCDTDDDCCSQFCIAAGRGITTCFGDACKGYGNECRYNKECCDGLLMDC